MPSVLNCGGWNTFLRVSRLQQAETYEKESLITHLSTVEAKLHATHNAVALWGFWPLAVVMLVLAFLGLGPLWRNGLRARLFSIFGLTTVLYIFLVLSTFSKYYVYTAPFYCALVVAALFSFKTWERFRPVVHPQFAFALAVALLVSADLCVTLPLLGRVTTFRSPVQSAYEYLVRQHGPDLGGIDVLTNQTGTVSASLRYYRLKSGVGFAEFVRSGDRIVPELNSGKQLYLLSNVSGGGTTPQLELLDTFVWDKPLRNILQAFPIDLNLFLYKVHDQLPATYTVKDEQLRPLLFSRGIDPDGWFRPDSDLVLPGYVGAGMDFVEMQGLIPATFDYHYPMQVTYEVRGQADGKKSSFTLTKPGRFDVLLSLDKPPAASHLDVHIVAPEFHLSSQGDPRPMAWQLESLRCVTPARPLLFDYVEDTWYDPESAKGNTWRWCHEEGKVAIAAARNGTLVAQFTVLSTHGKDRVDVILDGAPAGSVDVPNPGATAPQTLRLPVQAGLHGLSFRGQQPGERPTPTDTRSISVGVQDLQISLE